MRRPRCPAGMRRAQPSAAGASPSGASPLQRRCGLPTPEHLGSPGPGAGPAPRPRAGWDVPPLSRRGPPLRSLRAEPCPPAGLRGTRSGRNAVGRDVSRCPARGPPSPSPSAHPSPRGRGPSSPRSPRRSPREAAAPRSLVPPGRAGDGLRAGGGRTGPGARPRRACAGLSCPLAGKGSGAAPRCSRRPAALLGPPASVPARARDPGPGDAAGDPSVAGCAGGWGGVPEELPAEARR